MENATTVAPVDRLVRRPPPAVFGRLWQFSKTNNHYQFCDLDVAEVLEYILRLEEALKRHSLVVYCEHEPVVANEGFVGCAKCGRTL